MESILTREEIVDLLSAIKAGKISPETANTPPARNERAVFARDVDLFRTYERTQDSGEMRIPNFDIILDNFARNFGTSLTNSLQRNFTVERAEIISTDFQQSLQNLENQGAIGIYTVAPLKYGCLFHVDTVLAFTLLEIMLGSAPSNESAPLDRHLTTIEISILKTSMSAICAELQKAMRLIVNLEVHLTRLENNFRLVSIVEPDAEVLVIRFNVRIAGEHAGQMRLIVPYLTLEPIREKFKEMVSITQATTYNWSRFFIREVLEMESQVTARSGLVNMSIGTILSLKPGDIVDLHYNPDQPLTILVEDQPLFLAISGERNGKKAFHVTGRFSNKRGEFHGDT